MGRFRRNKNFPGDEEIQVDRLISTSYDIVKAVYDNLSQLQTLAAAVEDGTIDDFVSTEDIDTLAELNAIVADVDLAQVAADALAAVQPEDLDTKAELEAMIGVVLATEDYVNTAVSGLFDLKGGYDANTDTPAIVAGTGVLKADVYITTVAGTFLGENLEVGDELYALQDAPTTAAHWAIVNKNVDTSAFATSAQGALADSALQPGDNISELTNDSGFYNTGSQVETAYEAQTDTNKFTDAEKSKLAGIEPNATADQSNAEIESAYNLQVPQVSAGEKTAGTEAGIRRFSPQDIADMAGTHGGGGGGGGGMTALVKGVDYTASVDERVMVTSDTGTWTITLPASPVDGDKVSVWDCGDNAGSNVITVARNGNTINGVAEDFLINMDGGRWDAVYDGTTWEYSFVIQTVQPSQTITRSVPALVDANQFTFYNGASLVTTGSTYDQIEVVSFPDAVSPVSANFSTQVPPNWTGRVRVRIPWEHTTVTATEVRWFVLLGKGVEGQAVDTDVDATIDLNMNAPGTANTLVYAGWSAWTDLGSTNVDSILWGRVQRNDSANNDSSYMYHLQIEFEVTETLSALSAISNTASMVTRTVTGTTDTILATDNGKTLIYTNAAAVAVDLPDGLPADFQCTVMQYGAGAVTVTPSGSDTVNGASSGLSPSAQYAGMYFGKVDATGWIAVS